MDDIKRPSNKGKSTLVPLRRPVFVRSAEEAPLDAAAAGVESGVTKPALTSTRRGRSVKLRISLKMPKILAYIPKTIHKIAKSPPVKRTKKLFKKQPQLLRVGWAMLAILMIYAVLFDAWQARYTVVGYQLSDSEQALLTDPSSHMAGFLKYDETKGVYNYNLGYAGSTGNTSGDNGQPKFSATFNKDVSKGDTITDPVSQTSITFTPKYSVRAPRQDANRLIYPLTSGNGARVYTLASVGVKEDIVLSSSNSDEKEYKYKLGLADGTEARVERDGSLGVYGVNDVLLGNVGTGSDKDAELLQKARQNSPKTNLLYTFPAPFAVESGRKVSQVKVWYSLKKDELTLHAKGLDSARYPLTLDPSVYIDSAAKLMRGNNETNTDFDVDNQLIQKSQTTGARIDSWSSTNNLSNAVWGQGTAVAGGYIYAVGGAGGGSTTTTTYYTAGSSSYVVPAGITSLTIKAWGGGGGGGAGNNNGGDGGNGGGGGYAKAVITVTPSETLTVDVGSGGAKGATNVHGGDGGGYSSVKRSSTYLVQAGGGGGGGGARGSRDGGDGGAGGGQNGVAGGDATGAGGKGGGGGTNSAGGAGGATGTGGVAGYSGAANTGGDAGGYASSTCNTAVTTRGNAGGTGSGGAGGNDGSTCADGGGGGGGRYGGGGGGSTTSNNRGGGGGGGGSDLVTGSSQVETAGSGTTPGNNSDTDRGGAGDGGTGGNTAGGASAGDDGGVVISYTTTGAAATSEVSWAHFNSSTGAIESPNPGDGVCSGWCNKAVYDLPVALKDMSIVAYNGFLYVMGGAIGAGTPQTSVYIAKLGANGEPQLWHPSGGSPVYWYQDTNLPAARSKFGAVAYNNRMYIFGGLTTSTTLLSSNTVQYASINPTGTLTTFSSTGMQALSSARYGLSALVYNDTVYVVGGDATFSGTPITTVQYARLNTDGTMNSWQTTSSLVGSGRLTMGGSFATIWGAYIYVAGGCTAVNASGYCTSIASDVQLASINADGSVAPFNTILNVTNARIGHTLIAWQGGLYRLGGCRAQDSGTGTCTDTIFDVDYGVINPPGEASTVATSVGSGTAPCSGGNPYNCELPGVSVIGNVLNGSAILNGYLYIWGGCSNTNSGCGTVSTSVAYTSIGSTGLLTKPASCGSWSSVDSYCYNTSSLPGSVGAPGMTVFNGYIYSVGGFTAGGSVNQIYYTQPSTADGSISNWNSVSLTGVGGTNVSYPYAFARANPSAASTVPGNLYIIGGCSGPSGIGCNNYAQGVYKCELDNSGVPSNCSTSGQLQIGIVPGDTQTGLGAMAGTVYANYVYLMGGLTPNQTDIKTTRYAKIDNSNNIVAVSGGAWVESPNLTYYGRRRGAGFGYNGYLYVVGGYDGSSGGGGVLADIEFAKINVSDGSIGAWVVSSVNIDERWGLNLTISNSYAYVIGGCIDGNAPTCNAGGQTNSVQTFQVYNNDSGTPIGYGADDLFATDRTGAGSVIYNNYIYVAGGCTSATDCTDATNSVQYAPIDAYGDIGTWNSTTNLTQDRAWGSLVAAGGTLYFVGGQNDGGTAQTAVYYAVPQSNGTITSWSTASNALPAVRTQFGSAVWNNRIYVTGGTNGTTVQSTVYISPSLSSLVSGGNITSAWNSTSATSTAFNVARSGQTLVAYANNLYILGGYDGTNYLSDTQFAPLGYKTGTIAQSGTTITGTGTAFTSGQVGSTLRYDDGSTATVTGYTNGTTLTVNTNRTVSSGTAYTIMDGSVGAWTYSTSLPGPIRQGAGFAANGYIYLIGGRSDDGTCTPRTLVAPISANTTIASGNSPTGVGQWFETNTRYSGSRYGAAVSYNNGKIYLLGGGCAQAPVLSSVTSTSFATNATAHNATMPTTTAGDLLIALFSSNANSTVTTPAGWTLSANAVNGTSVTANVYTRVATGTDGSTVNFVTSAAETGAAQIYLIANGSWQGTIANGFDISANVNATTASPNPPALNPATWGTESTFWIAYAAGRTYTGLDNPPANYGNAVHVNGGTGTTGASTGSASRIAAVANEDPGTFSMSSSQVGIAYTMAVRGTAFAYSGSNRVAETAVYSQPQVAKYSRMIDTDTDVFANSWLLNGLDNSIGARWQMRYRSMNDTDAFPADCGSANMSTWGQETNFGDVTLGRVEQYIPRDGSGTNINCARYYFFSVSIDASQTFGYPEDVNRGPTITDLSLFFTSDPSKRLIHGKTFTGGEQQPLDTPCRVSGANPPGGQPNCPLP